jgi:hypothetical protein
MRNPSICDQWKLALKSALNVGNFSAIAICDLDQKKQIAIELDLF